MPYPIRRGYIYQVKDQILRLPPEEEREVHDARRPFVVLSNDTTNADEAYPVVSGCPISSSTTYRTEFDIKLSANEGNLSKKGWVRIHAMQPVLKADLEDCTGKRLTDERMEEIEAQHLRFIGVIPFDP